jgi:hypothetical protein
MIVKLVLYKYDVKNLLEYEVSKQHMHHVLELVITLTSLQNYEPNSMYLLPKYSYSFQHIKMRMFFPFYLIY